MGRLADPTGDPIERLSPTTHKPNHGAIARKGFGDGSSNSAAGARDERGATFERLDQDLILAAQTSEFS